MQPYSTITTDSIQHEQETSQGIFIKLFEEQVRANPNGDAVVFGNNCWSYDALDKISNKLSNFLRAEYQVGEGTLVGIIVERSDLTVISMLAVLKAGAAFVPVDPNSPAQRVSYLVRDTNMSVLLLQSSRMFDLQDIECPLFALDLQLDEIDAPEEIPSVIYKPTDLVYVIYTSGTTGFPKGVMIESSSLENYTTYIKRKFDLSVADKTVLLSSMAFDLGYTGLFGSLVSGGTLHIVADDFGKSPEKTLQYIIEAGITFIKTTPSMFFILTQVPGFEKYASDLSLRLVVLGGEPINCDDIERYWRFKPETRFANHYGPTETTIGTVVCPIDAGTFDQFKKQPVIGKAVHHNKVLTLDKNYQLTPVGIPGEICIGGKGVARGYLNNPELTHDKFFEAAWLNKMRLYRTGDFGKWLSNGNLAFIGRKDNQIKIRGYRVEIDEIVRTIQSQGNIVDARVIVKKDREGRPYLVAYVIPKNNDMTLDIKPQLSDALPDYMMPTHFVNLTSFPITANGKLDEKALPDPAESAIAAELKKPESELEVMLARIWQEVLNKTNIGINQSFFEIGGDSIKAIQVASKTYELQYKLEVKDIFQFPTIQQLAREIKPLHLVADQTLVTGNFPLTPIQKRFFTGRINNKNHYNQSVMLFSEQGFDEMATRAVFQKLIEHHDLLRATFTTNENGDVEGTIAAENHFDIETIDLRKMPVPPKALLEHVERKQAQLNVFEGPLFKLTIFKLDDGDRLHMAMHHLIVDGVSWRILFEDIGRLYQAYNDHKLLELPAKTHAYKEWAEKLSAYATSEALSREFGFWENIRKAKTSAIPYDKPAGSPGTIQNNRKLAFTLSTESTQRLLNDVNRLYRTSIKDILLAALGLAVKRSFNVQQVLIEQEGHGREEILDGIDVSRTVGWFTSKYPVVLDITNADDLRRAIVEVKEYLRKVPYNGIGFGILRYLTRNADAWCIDPQISFNYLGQFDGDIAKSSFRIADEPCGNQAAIDEERPYALDISGIVTGQKLSINILYSDTQFESLTIKRFGDHFENVLTEIARLSDTQAAQQLTPSDYLYKKLSIDKLAELQAKYDIENIYPLSPMQQGLFYHTLLDPTSTAYYSQTAYRIKGKLEPENVEASLNFLFKRYDVFRGIFLHRDLVEPIQVILKERKVDFAFKDFRVFATQQQKEQALDKFKHDDRKKLIDLGRDTLVRIAIIQLNDEEFELIWNDHHILKDGWSAGVMMSEFLQTYYSLIQQKEPKLAPAKPYSHYLQWLEKHPVTESQNYWRQYLGDYETPAGISLLKKYNATAGYLKKEKTVVLSEDKTQQLEQLARQLNVTLNTLVQTVWGIVLARYNGCTDLVFGNVVSGRPAEIHGVEAMVGLFINTIPVRVKFENNESFADVARAMQVAGGSSAPHHYLSLAEIQSGSPLKKNLIDHVLIFDNYPIASKIEGVENNSKHIDNIPRVKGLSINDHAHYDFSIVLGPGKSFSIKFDYNALAFDDLVIDNLERALLTVLDQVIEQPATPVEDISLIAYAEISDLYNRVNPAEMPNNAVSFMELWQRQVTAVPGQPALTFGTKIYTYAELDRIVNSLAFQLKATNNIQPGDFIGLMLEPSDWVIVSMLGIMKLGACFVPIDIDLPADRKKYITNDAGLKLLILNSEHLFDVGEEEIGCDLFAIDIQFDNTVVPDKSIHALTHGDSLAYAIYTSGTTGKPKGVTIRQKSLANYVLWLQSVTGLGPVDSGLLLTSHVFDLGFTTIFGCLGSGANLHLHQESVGKNPEAILRYLHDQQITFIKATPSIFYMISHLPLFQAASIDLRLRWIFLGGEKIKAKDILGFKGRYPHTRFVNHYGPTEATIGVIAHVIDNIEEFHHEPVIGKPIRNAQAFILDEKSRPVPVGAVGEICISGAGLAKGYLNQTKLTEEKFIAHPFQPGAKIYKTGDLGKLLPSGDIAIIGRRDGQLKVNGYRVETDEIVKCLIACDQVRDAVLRVVQNGNGENELVAYCAAQSEDEALIRKHLSKNLPAYMVPATLIYIEKIPVTANGKLNVKELPDLNQALRGTTLLKMPETPLQEKLVSIWKEVLQRNEVGITDNFFALGGDSIKAVRLVGSINTSLDQWVEVKDVFEYQDIEALSRFLESDRQLMERQKQMEEASIHLQEFKQDIVNQRALRKALPESYEDFFPMSDIQMGMLYHGFISPAEGVYHQEKFSQFRDSTFDPSVFEQAIKLMVHKHPILRTTFDLSNFDLPIQIVHKPLACVLPVTLEDLSDKPHEDIIAYLNTVKKKDLEKPFRDGKEFLWRLYAFKLSKDEYGLLFTYHHAILDGWSEASFYAELSHCYFELKNDRSYRPGVLKADYRDYVQAQWVAKKDERAKEFWQRTLEGYERTHLPFQKQLDKLTSRKQSVSRPFLLGEETVSKLDRLAALHHMHIKEIFLAAYLYLLKVTTGKNDVTIGLVTNSRPDKPDGDKVLGCFLNTIPFRYQFGAQMTVRQFIDHIAERINELRYYDRYPLPDILRAIGEETGNYNPIYDNRFDYVDFYIDKTTHHDADIARPVVSGRGNSDHRFSLNIRRSGEELAVRFFYIEDLYKAEEVERLEAYFKLTLDLLLGDEEKLLTSNAILPEKEIQVLLSAETPAKYPDKELIHTLFEKSAIQFPDNIAVVSEGRSLTYRQLNERANQIGHYLQKEKGVGAGELVGVLAGRNEMMPVMILGILKAGAGYVPIDPDHPQERNISLLDDASIKIVLCDQPSAMPSGLPVELVNVCAVNLDQYPVTDLKVINKPSDIAYIIFTSGSTGKPKGVVVEHENVVRLLFNNAFQFSFSERDTWTLFHSICFDFSVWEMYGALLYGGRLVMVPKQTAISPAEFVDLLIKEQVTVLNQVPAMFDNVVAEIKTRGLKRSDLRYIIFGGAALKPQNLAWWISNFPEMKLVNMYGITETTVHVTYKEVTVDMVREGSSNIGTPIPTLKTLLMDQDLGLVPANVPGEIVVSGKGVARGYLNRPELTSERFRTNPYDKDERIYLSGDLGYRNKEGELIYLGRKDSQIKLRGFRIEIGEIENAILKYPDVQNTVVLLSEGTKEVEKQLIAFILSQKELDSDSLRNFLATRLPDYMVPAQFVGLKKFPLTINKKIDFKALLKLQGNRLSTGVEYVEPQNALQAKLITIWRDELKTERVGIHDNFFALGGDSLKAIRLVAKMNAEASLSCKIADLFKHPTIAELTASSEVLHGENSLEHERIIGHGRISEFKDRILSDASQKEKLPADWVDIYPMTPIENGMIYSSILNVEHPVYYDQFTYKLGIQDYGKFLEACGLMIRRHDILRTAYYLGTFAEPLKVVLRSIETPIYLEDISSLSEEDQKATIKSYLERDLRRRLTFEGEVLWHMKVFLLSGTSYYLVWNFHHSILDGWSISQFKIELSQLLASAGTPDVSTLDELKYSYKDYCAIVLGRQASERTREFWKRKLSGFSQNKLPFNYSGKQKSNAIGAKIVQTIVEPETLEALEKLSAKHGVSFKSVCLAAHVFLLHVVSSEEDIVTGVVSHDRQAMEDGDRILGCFLNTVPLRVNIRDAKNNLSLIQNVERLLSETREHEIHLTDIARIIGEKTSMGNPIFDTILNYTDFHVLETWSENKTLSRKLDAVGVTKELKGSEMTNTLFDVEVSKTLGRFTARIKYRSSYFEDQDVKKALDLYVSILQYFASDPQGAISLQPLLSREELQEIVYTFNDTIEPYSDQRGLHELFEEVAEQQPTYTALRVNGRSVSYGDLNQASNKLAWKLIRAGVKPQDNVGLIVRRNEHMIIGMLAILKAGGAYVPVDPEYPVARQSYILENSSVTWVLSDDNYAIQEEYAATFKFMTTNLDVNTSGTEKNPGIKIDPTSLAYTIYTSGSTGKPKGVMIEHRSAVNLVEWVNKTYSVGREDRLLFVTSMCFDLSVYDIFGMLACGGTLVMATKEDVEQLRVLKQLLVEERITFWDSVPTTINYLINELDAEGLPFVQTDLRVVFMSGDWIPVNLPDKIVRFFPNAEVISLGGATEGTVWSNYYPIERGSTHAVSIPYGKPIANNFFYILDSHLNPVPKGVVGELYIGGIGVARGYANNEEKTAYAFMDDPFNKKLGGRMYRTGDLGRMRPDNNMEFIGRRDHQTKIRGYRVELGEIQSLLVKNDSIRDAVVEVFKDHGNNNFLCAYVVLKRETTVDEIKNYLSVSLPGYMIPTYFEFLSALPLNSNGKIDRKLLPAPDQSKLGNADTAQPRNALERKLAGLTAELLGKISVGIHDNFFDLGAHSLNISALANRIHRQLNVELSIRDVFSYPTVEGLAGLIQRKKSSAYEEILPIEEQEYYSATHAQKRFWFLQQKDDNQIAYNMPSAYLVEGYIDQTALEHAMKCLVKRHDSLRTTFMQLNGELVQKVNSFEHSEFSFVYLDLKGNKDNEKTARHWAQKIAKTHFDLERGPLIQTMLLRLEENKFVLLFSLHHIISDGWSKGIFLNELITFYNQQAEGVEATLKPLPLQYKDYAAWQNAKLSDESLERHKSYWMDKFKPLPPPIHLPYDRDRPEVNSYQGKEIGTLFSPELSARINDWGRKNEASLFMVAVTAVNVLLYRITGQHDFVIGTPVAGRDRTGLDRQIGLYLNTVMLRTSFDTNHSFEHLMQQVKENVLSGFEHQVYPFDRLIGDLNLKRDFNKTPLFNVWLVLQNMIDTAEGDTEIHNVKIKRFGNDFNVSRYDLRFTLNETSMGIMVALNYSTDLFEDATAKRILQVFESTVLQMIKNPATIIKDLFSQNNLTTTMQTTENQSLGLVKRNRQAAQSSVPTSLVTESLMASQQLLPHVVTANRKDVDLKQWISDNLDKVKTILLRNGAVLFRNFEVQSIAVFESIVAAYGENMVTYDFASTPRTKLKDKIYTSTEYPADQEILMHNEMAYTNNYPNHLWFFCHLPSQEGGATPLLDSRTVYEKLDPRVKEKFEKEKLMYVRYYHDKLDLSWKKAFQTEHREDVEAYCRKNGISFEWVEPGLLRTSEICEAVVTHPVTNQKVWFNQAHLFHISSVDEGIRNELTDLVGTRYPRNVYFGNGEEISDADLRIIKQSLLQHRIAFPWRQDDVLLVDNMLVAHGRMPYKGDRKIIVAMTK